MTGTGTALDPYIISDVDDLQAMEDDLDAYYELGGNIDASATSGWNAGAGFLPIGITTNPFTGQLDGKGYTIFSLFINRPSTNDVGLFGDFGGSGCIGVIQNIAFTSVDITGDYNVGALVGNLERYSKLIDNCSSTGSITSIQGWAGGLIGYTQMDEDDSGGGAITNSHSSCIVVSGDSYAGGLLGEDEYGLTMTSCYATGSVTGSVDDYADYIGGLVGASFSGTYSKCYATGAVVGYRYVGGLIGMPQGSAKLQTLTDCYARGATTATYYAGGLLGDAAYSDIDNCYATGAPTATGGSEYGGGLIADTVSNTTVTNCFWDTETSGYALSPGGGTGKTTVEMKTQATFTDAGWDFTTPIWVISSLNNGYPTHSRAYIYPSDSTTRVTSIIHRYDRGVYNIELLFGDVISDFSVPNVDSSTTKAYQSKEELDKINKAMPAPITITSQPTPTAPTSPVQPTPSPTVVTPPTEIVEPTQHTKDILATPAGQAALARQKGLAQGVEAVITPYAIDVLKRNEQAAKLQMELQKVTTAAKATGMTSYARNVLIKRAIAIKEELSKLR